MDRIQVNAHLRGIRTLSENPVIITIILPYELSLNMPMFLNNVIIPRTIGTKVVVKHIN